MFLHCDAFMLNETTETLTWISKQACDAIMLAGVLRSNSTLRTLNITTMEDLLIATRLDVTCNMRHERNRPVLNVHVPVFKKHLLGFMKHKCRGLFVDCDKLLDEKVVVTGGLYPTST